MTMHICSFVDHGIGRRRLVGALCAVFTVILAARTSADEYVDLAVTAIHLEPQGGGLFDVDVMVDSEPGPIPPSAPLVVRLLEDGVTFIDEGAIETFGNSSGICCDDVADCPEGNYYCGSSCPDLSKPYHCILRQGLTFSGLALTPGTAIVAVVDPDGDHTETGPGAGANNQLSTAIAADLFYDFGITDLRILPVGSGTYDVEFDIFFMATEGVTPTQPIPVRLFQDGDPLVDAFFAPVPPGDSFNECCSGPSDQCEQPLGWICFCDTEIVECAPPESPHQCHCHKTDRDEALALSAGSTLTAIMDPDTVHTEIRDGAPVNNAISVVVPAGIPTVSEWGLVVMALLAFSVGTILWRRKMPTGCGA